MPHDQQLGLVARLCGNATCAKAAKTTATDCANDRFQWKNDLFLLLFEHQAVIVVS